MGRIAVKEIIFTYRQLKNVSQTAKTLGISRPTVYRWIQRSQGNKHSRIGTLSTRGLARKSTTPKHKQEVLSDADKEKIIQYRSQHIGAKKIAYLLSGKISWRTIHRFLKKRQLVTWRPHQSLQYKTPQEVVHLYQMS